MLLAYSILTLASLATSAARAQTPTRAGGPVQLSMGNDFGCGVDATHAVKCWGQCSHGQCGSDVRVAPTPREVEGLSNIAQVVAGYSFACALRDDGKVLCWGDNQYGQLGVDQPETRSTPQVVPGLSEVTELALGGFHACALRADGRVLCWGGNTYANLGTPEPADRRASAAPVPRLPRATHLWAGQYFSCAQDLRGRIRCWGGSSNGQAGTRRRVRRAPVTRVRGLSSPEHLELGGAMGCVSTDGVMSCWGSNIFNVGPGAYWSSPQVLSSIHNVESMAVGRRNLCAVSGGRVFCWGVNDMEQLAVPTQEAGHVVTDPMPVPGLDDAVEIEIGGFAQCARRRDSSWVCWGYNARGGVGVGPSARLVTQPTPLPW